MAKFPWYFSEKSYSTWLEVRKKGKWRFVIFDGVIHWGMGMFVIMGWAPVYLGFPYRVEPTDFYFVWQLLFWIILGFFCGISVWYTSEMFFKRVSPEPCN